MKNDIAILIYILVTLAACIGIVISDRVSRKNKEEKIETIRIESPDSKLMVVAMRCHKMEQDNDMLHLRIEELEDALDELTNRPSHKAEVKEDEKVLCGQYYLFQASQAKDDLLD